MTSFAFSLRPLAYAYCRFILRHLKLPWFDNYQIVLLVALLGFLSGIAFLGSASKREVVNRYCPPWLYCALLICSLLIARLPTLLPGSLNPDEAMFLAGAMKLRHFPVFWRSLDGATSGPLNYYALTLLNLVGLPLDFATARLLNVLCIGGAIAVVYRIARLFMDDWTARLTPLPALAAAMAFRTPDCIHYSSECVSILLIALATWLLFIEGLSDRASWLRGAAIGLIAALLPLAKLQAAPVAFVLAAGGIAQGFFSKQPGKWRRALSVLAGLAAGVASLALFVFGLRVFHDFWQSYVAMNIVKANMYPPVPLAAFFRYCFPLDLQWYEAGIIAWLIYLFASSYFPQAEPGKYQRARTRFVQRSVAAALLCYAGAWWFNSTGNPIWDPAPACVLAGLMAGAVWTGSRPRSSLRTLSFFDLFTFLLLAASLYAVYRPRTDFLHYLAFLIFPLALLGARALAFGLRGAANPGQAVRMAGFFVLFTLAWPVFFRSKELRPAYQTEAGMARGRERRCAACKLVNQYAQPGDPVAVWGWVPEIYVLTGTLPATRDSHTPYQIDLGGPLLCYFRNRYLNDLRLHPPKVFVDAVGPRQFAYRDREMSGFETIPALREYVSTNFYLAGDVDGVRVFAKRDADDLKASTPEKSLRR